MALSTADGRKTQCLFTEISDFSEGIAWVNKGEYYAFIDSNLNYVTEFKYLVVANFKNGFAAVAKDSFSFGFINNKGIEICPQKYLRVKDFNHGYAAVQSDSGWGLIDSMGKEALACTYDFPPFVRYTYFIIVCQSGKWGVLDKAMQVAHPIKYDYINAEGVAYLKDKKFILGPG